jgi:CHAT domain-containing protein
VTKAQGEQIPALPGVLDELRGIIREDGADKQSGVLPGTVKLDEAFTQGAMLAGLRQRPSLVHIASHFRFEPGNETNSALLLGDGSFLSLAQIKSMPNVFGGVELLTLSACNTATGGSGANGKEVEGFGVLAQRQGAKAVVASLWPVADRSTTILMQEFYRMRESQAGMTKAEALRQAQLSLLYGDAERKKSVGEKRGLGLGKDSGAGQQRALKADAKAEAKASYAHPYYWAPFILIGNWK